VKAAGQDGARLGRHLPENLKRDPTHQCLSIGKPAVQRGDADAGGSARILDRSAAPVSRLLITAHVHMVVLCGAGGKAVVQPNVTCGLTTA
jgi:hypothetical protein